MAVKRIKQFMLSPETSIGDPTPLNPNWISESKSNLSLMPDNNGGAIHLINTAVKYGDVICLHGINLDATSNQVVAIIGQVGSGKTLLLNLILGELSPFIGKAIIKGRISYASQEAWLFAGNN